MSGDIESTFSPIARKVIGALILALYTIVAGLGVQAWVKVQANELKITTLEAVQPSINERLKKIEENQLEQIKLLYSLQPQDRKP